MPPHSERVRRNYEPVESKSGPLVPVNCCTKWDSIFATIVLVIAFIAYTFLVLGVVKGVLP